MRTAFPVIVIALGACAKGQQNVVQAPSAERLAAYKGVVVQKIETAGWLSKNPRTRDNPAYSNWRSEIEVASDQVPASAKKPLSEFYEIRGEPGQSAFVVQSELIEFDPGSADPLGGPNGRVVVRVVLVDGTSKERLGEAQVSATVGSAGGLRGAYEKCGQQIAKFVIEHRPKKK